MSGVFQSDEAAKLSNRNGDFGFALSSVLVLLSFMGISSLVWLAYALLGP
jgi:hypothetical protein